jgi:hypothetical protein
MHPKVVFRALYDAGIRYRVIDGSLRFPRGLLTAELREYVMAHKDALLAGPCSLCGAELATHGDRCEWCHAIRGREVTYQPGSEAERTFLSALERNIQAKVANAA